MAFHPDLPVISRRAEQIEFRTVVRVAVSFPPYAVGWTLAKVVRTIWLGFAYAGVAFSAGWKDALSGPAR